MKKLFKKNGKKGFTLAEVLIVIAIIAILLGIAIPVFSAQTEKAHEAVDASTIRNCYAAMMTEAIGSDAPADYCVKLEQTKENWQDTSLKDGLTKIMNEAEPGAGGYATLTFNEDTTTITLGYTTGSTQPTGFTLYPTN